MNPDREFQIAQAITGCAADRMLRGRRLESVLAGDSGKVPDALFAVFDL
jgi:hypothetical protein